MASINSTFVAFIDKNTPNWGMFVAALLSMIVNDFDAGANIMLCAVDPEYDAIAEAFCILRIKSESDISSG